MKIIKVIIKTIGTAIVTTGEVHSENENKASVISWYYGINGV
jgi:hypothetical protein